MRTIMKHVRLVDGTGAAAIEDGLLIMRHAEGFNHDHIEYAGAMDETLLTPLEADDKVLDLQQKYTVLPGLFDAHVHLDLECPFPAYDDKGPEFRTLMAYRQCVEALNIGVTSLRNVGAGANYDMPLKRAFAKNMLCGPNLVVCGGIIMAHGGHGWNMPNTTECSGTAEFMKAARNQIKMGVDMVKLCYTGGIAGAVEGLQDMQMTDEEVACVIAVTHAAGKKVAAHLSNDKAIRRSVELGLDSVEHAYTLSEETAKMMAEAGTYLTPTLTVSNCEDYYIAHGFPPHQLIKSREAAKTHRASIATAVKCGVKICCGTDTLPSDPIDGTNSVVHEIELLTEVGLSPLEAIKAATYNSAELCGLEKVTGTLRAGLMGDIIVVEGKPDENIRDLRNLRLVAKNCRLLWSTLPEMTLRRLSILAPGYEMAGGTFNKW